MSKLYKNSNLLNDQSTGRKAPSLSSGSVLGVSNRLPPNSLFHLFANNINTTSVSSVTSSAGIQSPISTNTIPTSTSSATSTATTSTSKPIATSSSASSSATTSSSTSDNIVIIESNKEDDKECGTILMEINKGIRSGNLGDQVESILFFSHLIKFHPSPLIVNSVITRLSDIFRNTSNTVKYRILKVFQECSSEIHKVSNIEEVLKRIHSVILSNDPIARSLSLRVLGSVPHLIADKLYIHHSIRTCMQSHDQVELEATIFIMDRLCEISPLFSDSIIEKIHTIIQNVETPPITKLKYTRLFRHMHHSHSIATQSKEMLVGLLDLYPSVNFVSVILDTLTDLSLKHILYIDDHIKFLKNFGFQDSRVIVRVISLKCLQRLVTVSPHSQFPIIELFNLIRDTPSTYREIKYNALLLLSIISITQYNKILELNGNAGGSDSGELLSILYQYSLDYDLKLSELSIQTLVNIIVESSNNNNNNQQEIKQLQQQLLNSISNQTVNNICVILKTQFTTSTTSTTTKQLTKSSILLKSIIQFIKNDSKQLKPIATTIISLLDQVPYNILKSLFHCLSICISMNKSVLNQNSIDLILKYLINLIITENSNQLINNSVVGSGNSDKYSIPMSIFICIFKTFDENNKKIQEITGSILPLVQYILDNPKSNQLWNCYSLAQLSQRFGFHKIAKVIYSKLINKVESECNYLWLKGLLSISTLENEISISITSNNINNSRILKQLSNYHTSILSIKASSNQERSSLQFQEDFILLRQKYLFNILNLKSFLLQNNNNGTGSGVVDEETIIKKYSSKSLVFKQLEQKYQILLNNNQIWNKSAIPLDTKQILESFIFSCNLIVKLIDSKILPPQQQHMEDIQTTTTIRNNNQSNNVNYFPLFKLCEFIQKKFNNNGNQSSDFLDQVLNSLIKIPMVYPSSFY